ncbi:MAG: thiamine-phosphate kinase [bacterium]|nr:thiamine-phosphate kinase [bacterium]
MSKKLRELGELAIVDSIRKRFRDFRPRALRGIGDDAAVILPKPGSRYLVTTDLLIEKVHFDLAFTSPRDLGFKSLTVNLSDLAAMGGVPRYAFLGLGLPAGLSRDFLNEFFSGWARAARRYETNLVGGDLSRAPAVFIAVTVVGETLPSGFIGRDGARPGDGVFVSGWPGESALGLEYLSRGKQKDPSGRRWIRKHLLPEPRLRLGQELSRRKLAHSLMDLSDGLVLDLRRLARESRAAIEIETGRIVLATGFSAAARKLGRDPLRLALSGGEDYELIFTAPPKKWEAVEALARELKLPLSRIGMVKAGKPGVKVLDRDGKILPLSRSGYEHFIS